MRALGALLLLSLCLPGDAWGGQLHVKLLTLGDVARGGFAVLGTVVSVYASRRLVTVKTKKLWQNEADNGGLSGSTSAALGDIREFKIYGGVVWDDPRVSPVDIRVRGTLTLSQIEQGQDVIVVLGHGYEVLPADVATQEKLDFFFSEAALTQYKQNAPEDILYADLNDLDLSKVALEAMVDRRLLAPRAFIGLPEHKFYELGWQLGQRLSLPQYDAWIESLIPVVGDPERRLVLVDLAREFKANGKVSEATMVALMASLDLQNQDQQSRLRWYVHEEARALSENPDIGKALRAVEFALSLMALDAYDDWQDQQALRSLIGHLPQHQKIAMIRRLGRLVMSSRGAVASESRFDAEIFYFFLEQVKRLPSLDYLAELEAIDLSFIPKTSQQRVESYAAILEAGWAIAQADLSRGPVIYAALQKWSRDPKVFEPELVISIEAEKPDAKRKRWRATLEKFNALKHGETRAP